MSWSSRVACLALASATAVAASTSSTEAATTPVAAAPRSRAIPVLLFHAVCPEQCSTENLYGITQGDLERLLTMLDDEGIVAISSATFDAFVRGRHPTLPERPILLTFDDGRLDGYRGADGLLAAHHSRATMFLITGKQDADDPRFMSWDDVQAASASGRWDIELHAHAGHSRIRASSTTRGTFFGSRRWLPTNELEAFEDWRMRATSDIKVGEDRLEAHLPGRTPHLFALPFGDYGQFRSNDPAIQVALASDLNERYGAWFTQPSGDPGFATERTGEAWRFTIRNTTDVGDVRAWLTKHAAEFGTR